MSFKVQPASPARPNRCQLFGPGSRPAIFEKMAGSAADVINLDLEDSVAPADKAEVMAEDPRRNTGSDHCPFNQQSAGAAHRIQQRAAP